MKNDNLTPEQRSDRSVSREVTLAWLIGLIVYVVIGWRAYVSHSLLGVAVDFVVSWALFGAWVIVRSRVFHRPSLREFLKRRH